MRKILCVLMIMVLCLSACAEGMTGMPSPLTEYESLNEINELIGCNLMHPAVMGVINESFWIIDCGDYRIAQYVFELNGLSYTFRCAPTKEDISGVYTVNGSAFPGEPTGDIELYNDSTVHAARWFDLNGQYSLTVADYEGWMSNDTFSLIAMELRDMTSITMTSDEYEAYYASVAGSYLDSFSGRANLTARAKQDECVNIEVKWSDSASTYLRWTMSARLYEDGLLSYYDCKKEVVTVDESGVETAETEYENGSGWFAFDGESKLYWTGADEDYATECVFEKVNGNY